MPLRGNEFDGSHAEILMMLREKEAPFCYRDCCAKVIGLIKKLQVPNRDPARENGGKPPHSKAGKACGSFTPSYPWMRDRFPQALN